MQIGRALWQRLNGLAPKLLPSDFSPETYLELNPDLRRARVDPVKHYLRHGLREGRAYKKPEPNGIDSAAIERLHELGFEVRRELRHATALVADRRETVFLKRRGTEEKGYPYPDLYRRWSTASCRVLRLPEYYGTVEDFHVFEFARGPQFAWSPVAGSKGCGGEGIPLYTVGQIISLAEDLVSLGVHSDFHWGNFIFADEGIFVVDWDIANFRSGTMESLLAYLYLLMFRNRPWQAELIRQAKARAVIREEPFRTSVDHLATLHAAQFEGYPGVQAEMRSVQRVFRTDRGFRSVWRGLNLLGLLDRAGYHVHDELGQVRQHASQIDCRGKLRAIRLDRLQFAGKRVLDVGCSSGWFMNEFLKLGPAKVTGVDVSEPNCQLARGLLTEGYGWRDFDVLHMDVLDLPETEYDLVMSLSMFHYIEKKPEFFRKVAALLAERGTFVLETPVHEGPEDVVVWDQQPTRYIPSVDYVRRLGVDAGLEIEFFEQSNLAERRVFHFVRRPGEDGQRAEAASSRG